MGYSRLQDAIKLRLGSGTEKLFSKFIKNISRYTPFFLIRYTPKSLSTLFGSCALLILSDEKRIFSWANRASKSKFLGHQKAALYIKLNYSFANKSDVEFSRYVNSEIFSFDAPRQKLDFYLVWSFHNNSQYGHSSLLNRVMADFKTNRSSDKDLNVRYLPEHTTNMGHLGYLFLYANFYRKNDMKRELAIWPEISPNKFYLRQLIKILPFKLRFLKGAPENYSLGRDQIDTLQYSLLGEFNWRLEASCTIPTFQTFPEYLIDHEFRMFGDINFSEFAITQLERIGFERNRWFAALHVKEHQFGFAYGGETRDSSIQSFGDACGLIRDLGGQVVRMGGGNFPLIDSKFNAIDYANSDIKSEQIDFWLWANCKFWFGNSNGASVAVIPFAKPRLLVDLWPIHVYGPPRDLYLPKIIYNEKTRKVVLPSELVNMKISRTMRRELFPRLGLKMFSSPPKLIKESVAELIDLIESPGVDKLITFSEFEMDLLKSMQQKPKNPIMRLPTAFNYYLDEFLSA